VVETIKAEAVSYLDRLKELIEAGNFRRVVANKVTGRSPNFH